MELIFVLGIVFITIVLTVLGAIWSGYVLSILWGWFIVPTFNLPALSIPLAIGIALVISYVTHQTNFDKKKEELTDMENLKYAGRVFSWLALKPALALLIGWIVLKFI